MSLLCSVADCGKLAAKGRRGFCGAHYKRWYKHGDPTLGGTSKGELTRFFREVVLPCKDAGCLIWPYSTNGVGYGLFRRGYDKITVHRTACEMVHGPAPTPKHEVAHNCGKGHLGCVNPMHLRWATRSENQLDRRIHGTANYKRKAA